MDAFESLAGVPVVVVVPAVVEVAKRAGLPVRWAGVAAIVAATLLVALADLAANRGGTGGPARWAILGVVYGLAGAGLYSQARPRDGSGRMDGPNSAEEVDSTHGPSGRAS